MKTYEPNEIIPVDEAILLLRKWGTYSDYIEGRLLELIGDGISPLGIVALDFPVADRLWVLLHEEILSPRDRRLLACRWAEGVLPIFERECPGDARPREMIAMARRHADGKASDEELADAAAATWPTRFTRPGGPPRDARPSWGAWYAAWAVRATPTDGAAKLASSLAVWAAVWAVPVAARAATGTAAQVAQLADIRAVLEGTAVDDLPVGVSQ